MTTYAYDQNSNILTNGENAYSYDVISRLTSIDKHDNLVRNLDDKKQEKLTIDYNYDNLGNRDSVEQTTSWITKKGKEKEKTRIADYMSNTLNQYTSVSSLKREGDDEKHGNSGKFVYDKAGNLTQDSNQRYSYDYRNRLIKVESYETNKKGKTEMNFIAEFKYDVLGRRTTKVTYNDDDEVKKIVRYIYSNQDAIEEVSYGIRDMKEKLKDTKEYVYGKGIDDVLVMIQTTPDGKKQTEKRYFFGKNQLGSITAITDSSGKLVEEYKYDEFGKAYTRKEKKDDWKVLKKSEIGNTRLFTGREYDKEIGLYYYRARYYSADLGRFMSRDPIGTRDNVNLYSYVSNNPLRYTDPMGREKALIREKIASWAEQQYIYNNPLYYDNAPFDLFNTDTWGYIGNEDIAKCNIFVGDAYIIGGGIDKYPYYDGSDNYFVANDLANKDLNSFFNVSTDSSTLKHGDIVAWQNSNGSGHSSIYIGKNYKGEDIVVYAGGGNEIKINTISNMNSAFDSNHSGPYYLSYKF